MTPTDADQSFPQSIDDTSEPTVDDVATPSEIVLPSWQNPVNIVTMIVTVALLAGMLGWLVGHSRNEVKSSTVDTGFLQDMRVHHEQAVDMSRIFLERPDTDRGLVVVAQSIQLGQSIEIGLMIQLLRDMDAPTESEEGQAMSWMGMPMSDADMPGMASDEQLQALAESTGAEADRLFVELMIAHHRGGIEMSNGATARAMNEFVLRYAELWASSEAEEIAELQGLLAEPADGD